MQRKHRFHHPLKTAVLLWLMAMPCGFQASPAAPASAAASTPAASAPARGASSPAAAITNAVTNAVTNVITNLITNASTGAGSGGGTPSAASPGSGGASAAPKAPASSAAAEIKNAIGGAITNAVTGAINNAVTGAATPASAPAAPASAAAAPAAIASAPLVAPTAAGSAPRATASQPPPAAVPAGPSLSMAGGSSALHLLVNPVPLPTGHVGAPYRRIRIVLDGVAPYTVQIDGSLPAGMTLGADGFLAGTPTATGVNRFVVRAADSATPPVRAQQAYVLRVIEPSKGPAKAASAPASAPQPLTALTAEDAKALPGKGGPSAMAWRLTPADLEAFAPDPNAPAPEAQALAPEAAASAPLAVGPAPAGTETVITEAAQAAADAEAARLAQLRQMLQPLVDAEFPTRQLFEAALDAHLCRHVRALVVQAERNKGLPPSGGAAVVCPPPPPTPGKPKLAAAPSTPATGTGSIPLSELPAWLLPPDIRAELVAAAQKRYPLDAAKPPQWTDGNCGCVHEDMLGEVYGFYPFWAAAGKPQQLDFSLLTRIAVHAATFGDDGSLQQPASWTSGPVDFAVQAERHGTQMDLVVWRNDWKTLLAQDDARLERTARELARNAIAAVDAPLRDRASRLQRYLPFYAAKPTMADGITVFFDNAPSAATDPAGAQAFASFLRKFMLALFAQMRAQGSRSYTLHLALTAAQIGTAPFDYDTLFDYVRRAEDPRMEHQRIQDEGDTYRSRTNVTLRFVVLLPEPTTLSKKALRKSVEDARNIHGNDRRILLRKLIAAISYNGADPQQLVDDLAYFRDNFGGVGFWQVPMDGVGPGTGTYQAVNDAFRKDPSDSTTALCKLVCTQRWIVRGAFQLLVAALLLGLVAVGAAGGLRCVGRKVVLALLLLAALAVFTGGSLLNCDPDFRTLREGNVLFWTVLVLLFAAALFTTLKPRDPRP